MIHNPSKSFSPERQTKDFIFAECVVDQQFDFTSGQKKNWNSGKMHCIFLFKYGYMNDLMELFCNIAVLYNMNC